MISVPNIELVERANTEHSYKGYWPCSGFERGRLPFMRGIREKFYQRSKILGTQELYCFIDEFDGIKLLSVWDYLSQELDLCEIRKIKISERGQERLSFPEEARFLKGPLVFAGARRHFQIHREEDLKRLKRLERKFPYEKMFEK